MVEITVLMVTYNNAAYIRQAIDSILNQTFVDYELLVVNDGSTDETQDILDSYHDARIRIINNIENQGIRYSRNIALNEARGKYLAILDSDDIATDDRLQLQWNTFQERPTLALLGGQGLIIDEQGRETGEKLSHVVGTEKVKAELIFCNSYIHSTIMLPTNVFRQIGGYKDFPLAEDYSLVSRISCLYEVDNLPNVLVKYRRHEQNISRIKACEMALFLNPIVRHGLQQHGFPVRETQVDLLILPANIVSQDITSYYQFLKELVNTNRQKKRIHVAEFEKRIFNIWYEALMDKTTLVCFFYMFRLPFPIVRHMTAKQFRRSFKRTVKSLFSVRIKALITTTKG